MGFGLSFQESFAFTTLSVFWKQLLFSQKQQKQAKRCSSHARTRVDTVSVMKQHKCPAQFTWKDDQVGLLSQVTLNSETTTALWRQTLLLLSSSCMCRRNIYYDCGVHVQQRFHGDRIGAFLKSSTLGAILNTQNTTKNFH